MNRSTGETQQLASKILTELKEQEGSWMRVDGILQFSQLVQTKYYALQILESLIQTRWKTLPREQCEGVFYFCFIFDLQKLMLLFFSFGKLYAKLN